MLFRKKFFRLFQVLSDKRWDVAQRLLAAFSKVHFKSPGNYFSSHFLMFDDLLCQFPSFSEIFSSKYRNVFLWVLRIVSKEKKSFEQRSVLRKSFGFWAKKVHISGIQNQQECQTSVQLARRNILKKTMLKRKTFFISISEIDWETLGSCPEKIGCVL